MNTFNKGQNNRFLDTPFIIRDTSPEGQVVFATGDNFAGGVIFKKDGFSMPLVNVEQISDNGVGENDGVGDEQKE